MDAIDLLRSARTVLLIDWPAREVPEALARAGMTVISHDGPDPSEYNAYEEDGAEVNAVPVGRAPERADLVYTHRPIDELPGITETARTIGASAVWYQSGLDDHGEKDPRGCWLPAADAERARAIVEQAGLAFIDSPYIVDALREPSIS